MRSDKFEIVRQTKLDLAQWIAAGMATCRNPVTSLSLARYAAAQLEGAAMISSFCAGGMKKPSLSLLRETLKKPGRNADCFAVLISVSRAMVQTLAGTSAAERKEALRDINVMRLIKQEARAAGNLTGSLPKPAAA